MNTVKAKLVKSLGRAPDSVPNWSKPVLRPFSGIYSRIYRAIYSSIKEEELVKTPTGPLIYVNYWDYVEREIANGSYERKYVDFFCSEIKEGDVVVDVGSYIGYFSLLASERVGDTGCVYAFEPVPRNYERLMRNLKVNQVKNVKAYNFGLSDKEEVLPIYVPKDNPGETTLQQKSYSEITQGTKMEKERVKVSLIPFDSFFEDNALDRIDVVKMDIEGAELKALKGMENALSRNNCKLFMEINAPLLNLSGVPIENLFGFLMTLGFKTCFLVDLKSKINLLQVNSKEIKEIFDNRSINVILEHS